MSAGKIEVTFEGLCPFFTKHLSEKRLMVGVLGVFGADLVTHTPTMTILEEDVPEPVIYKTKFGRKALSGEGFFHLFSEEGVVAGELSQAENLALLDVETELYHEDETEDDELEIDPGKCQVRLHFSNGMLSPMQSNTVGFFDLEEDELIPTFPQKSYTYNAKLQIEIPEGGYAVLHFSGEADDVVFKSGRNYVVKIESLPTSEHDHHENTEDHHEHEEEGDTDEVNHFQYFYLLAKNELERIIVPKKAVSGPVDGNPFCMLAEFGNTEY
jgi:hypothetical protein